MLAPLLAILVAAPPPLPPECEQPPLRDTAPLAGYAKKSGALSVTLDSIATWCFDSGGGWTGGVLPGKKKKKVIDPDAPASGDCAKAITSCESAKLEITDALRELLYGSLSDLERPYLGMKYTPKRSGLQERPTELADCRSRTRSELFTQAQARMDLARLASQAQNEYANYKTWLFGEGLKCAQLVAKGVKDPTRKGIAIDSPVKQGGGTMDAGGAAVTVTKDATPPTGVTVTRDATGVVVTRDATPPTGVTVTKDATPPTGVVVTRDAAPPPTGVIVTKDATPPAGVIVTKDATPPAGVIVTKDPTTGVVVKKSDPATVAVGRSNQAGGAASGDTGSGAMVASVTKDLGVGGPTTEREKALSTTLLSKWKYFADETRKLETDPDYVPGFLPSREVRDCKCARINPSEIVRRIEANDRVAQLEADDEKNSKCAICQLDAYFPWKTRALKQCSLMDQLSEYELGVLERSDDGNGLPPRCFETARNKRAGVKPDAGAARVAVTQPGTVTTGKSGSAFIITKSPDAQPPRPTNDHVKPNDYAPIPEREEGRMYVRVFMSSACVAEILPGPLQARTGDLMPVPMGARSLTVKSSCGGLAEVYWGREEKPRVSETFGKNQPLSLQFQAAMR